MMGKSTLEFLRLSIISTGLVLGCLEEFQIHTDCHSKSVQNYPNNETEIVNLTITCCLISSIYEYNYMLGHLNVPQALTVNLMMTQLPVLPKWTGITEIKITGLRENVVSAGAFNNLPKLKKLNFARNMMSKIPDMKLIGVNDTLENLILSHNKIREVDVFLDAEEIHLDYNPVKIITVPFENVKVLNLNGTELDTIEYFYFRHPEKLEKLHLAYSSIYTISVASFRRMFNLEDLNLNYNQITDLDIDIFRDLKNLKILKLSHNQIENLELGLFDNLINLEILDISYNVIEILDEKLLNPLVNLKKFWLNDNRIDWWEVRGIKMHNPNLTEVNLMGNVWICANLAFIVKHLEIQNITLYKDINHTGKFSGKVKGVSCAYQNKPSQQFCVN